MPTNKPLFINTDASLKNLKPDEVLFAKDVEISFNKNGNQSTGTANPSGEGQNEFVLTPVKSLKAVPDFSLPTTGYNKNIGSFESKQTNEVYCFTYNSLGQHCIHVINGDTGAVEKIIQDSELNFSDNQEHYIADNRCTLRVIRDYDNQIVEKILLFTDYNGWPKWINTIAAKRTAGFNVNSYPYWQVKQPHFDRAELMEWPTRPPMFMPEFIKVENTAADLGTPNRIIDLAFEVCFNFIYTDGRETTVSPWSLPMITKTTDFISNPDLIPKKYLLTLYAGSPLVEKINIYVRQTTRAADSDLQRTFGDWYLYDTIYKFKQSKSNIVIGTEYWLRENPWVDFEYDSDRNTIEYIFDNTKAGVPVDQSIFRVENDIPQISCALADAGDAVFLANNRHQYDNFPIDITEKISTSVVYNETSDDCQPLLRTVSLYCYIGRERVNQSDEKQRMTFNMWVSQIGYHKGEDSQEKFGGILFPSVERGGANIYEGTISFDTAESDLFELNFADREGFVCYAKGTPYFSVCEWFTSDANLNLLEVKGLIDSENTSDKDFVRDTLTGGKFFVGKFTFTGLPSGIYNFAIGRHNVQSDEDYRGQSTYVMGIADSRDITTGLRTQNILMPSDWSFTSLTPSAIVDRSKEIEVDCTAGDIDLWGTGKDTFYIFCPFGGSGRDSGAGLFDFFENPVNRWSLNEGYLVESRDSLLGMEKFQYESTYKEHYSAGVITDKNGFFFTYQWGDSVNNKRANTRFQNVANCSTIDFTISNTRNDQQGWKPSGLAYFSSYNGNLVGVANRVLVRGTIVNTLGIPLSNIAVTIQDGMTDYTDDSGEFTLVVHNGLSQARVSNIYINAGGNFTINMENCAPVPVFVYDQNSSYYPACVVCTGDGCEDRVYGLDIELAIEAKSGEIQSLKSGATYIVAIVGHDLAGRQTFVNRVSLPSIPSFPQRDNIYGSSFAWALNGALNLDAFRGTEDIKYLSFYVSKYINYRKYLQWVGDKIEFLDQNGNVTTNIETADLVRVTIQSLLDTNIQNNFTLLSTYQFVINDRLRVFDNGDGEQFDTATYGDVIDVEIQGTNYNQSAINANLIVPPVNTVLSNDTTQSTTPNPTTLYVKYDRRFDKLNGKTGFWIELYTPELVRDKLNFGECEGTYPIIDGEIQEYVSGGQSAPIYEPITSGAIRYWDTYYLRRTIIGLGKFISHPFESPNISDTFGPNGISSGRSNFENPEAKQQFYVTDIIKSDAFITSGTRNGLSMFRGSAPNTENRKTFKRAWDGGITAMKNVGNLLFVLLERNWFTVAYNQVFLRAGENGSLQTVNLTNNLGEPNPKVGGDYGCAYDSVATVIFEDKWVGWHDSKNSAYLMSDWNNVVDVTEIRQEGKSTGISSYYTAKCQETEKWNLAKEPKDRIDVVAGYDVYRSQLYITFRPRRSNSANVLSFVSTKRDLSVLSQETLVFDNTVRRWIPCRGFTPEGYGKLRGNIHSQELISFVNGKPYYHNADDVTTWCNYYGVVVTPVIKFVINEGADVVKILKNLKIDSNKSDWISDLIYSDAINSFSYLPLPYWDRKENMEYGAVLRNANSYPSTKEELSSQCMLIDGKPITGAFFVVRILPTESAAGQYFELDLIRSQIFESVSNQKPSQ